MSTMAVEIKEEELAKSKDMKMFRARLNEDYDGNWVIILDTGDLIVSKDLDGAYSEAKRKSAKIAAVFRAVDKKQQLFR